MSHLSIGMQAPTFTTTDQDGNSVKLQDYLGKTVILYFYPKDDTPGCTRQACAYRDHIAAYQQRNAVVLGISPNDAASHQNFSQKYGLNFPLLTDPDSTIAAQYGVWVEKKMYGRTYMGIERTTFEIDVEGNLKNIFRKVKPAEHPIAHLASLPS